MRKLVVLLPILLVFGYTLASPLDLSKREIESRFIAMIQDELIANLALIEEVPVIDYQEFTTGITHRLSEEFEGSQVAVYRLDESESEYTLEVGVKMNYRRTIYEKSYGIKRT